MFSSWELKWQLAPASLALNRTWVPLSRLFREYQAELTKIIDEGPDAGIELCVKEADLGLKLMQSFSPQLQKKAQIYSEMHDLSMPAGRWNLADQVRHPLAITVMNFD